MTVLDRLRHTTLADRVPLLTAARGGASAALATAAVPVVVALLAFAAASSATAGVGQATALGVDGWFLAQGARISAGSATLAFTPLLWTAAVLAALAWSARRLTASVGLDGPTWRGLVGLRLLRAYGAFIGSYAVTGALLSLLTLFLPARPAWWSALFVLVATPAAGCLLGLTWHCRDVGTEGPLGALPLPSTLRRALGPALRGTAATVATGALMVLVGVVLSFGDIVHVTGELHAGFVGDVLLWAGQLSVVPNLGLWGMSFAAGSGVHVVAGASTTWTASQAGLMPMVPFLASLPSPGRFPMVVAGVVLIPVGLGAYIGTRVVGSMARLARGWTKASVAATAALLAALLVGLLDAFGGGSWGAFRLSDVGAPALLMTGLLAVELCFGALLPVAADQWRLHRR